MKTDHAVARTATTVITNVLFFTAPPYKASDPAESVPYHGDRELHPVAPGLTYQA